MEEYNNNRRKFIFSNHELLMKIFYSFLIPLFTNPYLGNLHFTIPYFGTPYFRTNRKTMLGEIISLQYRT